MTFIVPDPRRLVDILIGMVMPRQQLGLSFHQKHPWQRVLCRAILVGGIVAVANVGWAGTWDETIDGGGDAIDLPHGQETMGSGPLTTITGTIWNADLDVDMYCITIDDPNNFSASVTDPGIMQLFLFDFAGGGVAHQVDSIFPYTTTISSPFIPAPAPGMFFLAISRPNLDAQDGLGNPLFPNNPQVQAPVITFVGPVAQWGPVGSGLSGAYTITLTGASYCGVPEPGALSLLCCGLGVIGCRIRRRVRTFN